MRILIVIGSFPPEHSGAGIRTEKTYARMAELYPIDWSVVTVKREKNSISHAENVSCIDILTFQGKIDLFIHILRGEYDLIHCVGQSSITWLSAWYSLFLRKNYVCELSIDPDRKAKNSLRQAIFSKAFFKATAYIALTPRLKTVFQSKDKAKPVFLRPNPVTLDMRSLQEASFVTPIPRSALYSHLLLGRFIARKGHKKALALLSLLPDHEIIFAGPVIGEQDIEYLKELRGYVARNGFSERVHFLDRQIDDVRPLMENMDSLWCLSEREGLPNVVLEALWLGKPVFVNADLGLDYVVLDGVNGYSLQGNADSDASLIDKAMRAAFDHERIQADARRDFSLDRHVNETWSFLNKIRKI